MADNPSTSAIPLKGTTLPLAAIICIAIGGYVTIIFILLFIRSMLLQYGYMQRGMCSEYCNCCGKEGEPGCCECCMGCIEVCSCKSPNMTACLDSICPTRKKRDCTDIILCQCCMDADCCGPSEPICDCCPDFNEPMTCDLCQSCATVNLCLHWCVESCNATCQRTCGGTNFPGGSCECHDGMCRCGTCDCRCNCKMPECDNVNCCCFQIGTPGVTNQGRDPYGAYPAGYPGGMYPPGPQHGGGYTQAAGSSPPHGGYPGGMYPPGPQHGGGYTQAAGSPPPHGGYPGGTYPPGPQHPQGGYPGYPVTTSPVGGGFPGAAATGAGYPGARSPTHGYPGPSRGYPGIARGDTSAAPY